MQSHPLLSPQDFWSTYLQSRVAHIRNTCYLDKSHHGYARARQMIDDELGEMYVAMHALRTERNTLAPVCRLPPEILSRIFLMCTDNSLPQMGRRSWCRPLGWLQVTHVCKRWRKTALHYPYIWTKISSGLSKPWLQKTIARAKSLPLSITFDSVAMMTHQREISKHISRIRDFSLYAEHADFLMPTLQAILASPVNVLQHLCITHDGWTDLVLPENTLQYYAPALHSVDLRSVYIPWSSPILYNLTHLKANLRDDLGGHAEELNRDEIESDKLPSCHLLSGLRGMPALQSLDLTFCLPSEGDGSVVDLPKLKSLTLKDEPARCTYFVTCLRIPSSCSLTLVCNTYSEKELTDGVIPIFHSHVKREQGPIQSLALKAYKSYFVFHISRAANGAEKTEPSYTLQLSHPTYASGALALPWPTVATLCRELPIENVRHLDLRHQEGCNPDSHMEHAAHWSPGAWVNILGRCGVAHEVRFYGDRPATLAFCLALTLRARREGAPFLENLCSLTLRGLRFTAADQGEGSEFLKAFLEQLAARQKIRTIQTICIKWKRAGEQFIVELGKIAPEVKWNELKDIVGESDISDKDEEDEENNEDWSDEENNEDWSDEEDEEDGEDQSDEEVKEDEEDKYDEEGGSDEDQDNEDGEDQSD